MAFNTVKTSATYYPKNALARGLVFSGLNNLIRAMSILDELNTGIELGKLYHDLTVVKAVAEQYYALTGDIALYQLAQTTTEETLLDLVSAIQTNNGFATTIAAIINLWEVLYQNQLNVATNSQGTMSLFDNPIDAPPGWPTPEEPL